MACNCRVFVNIQVGAFQAFSPLTNCTQTVENDLGFAVYQQHLDNANKDEHKVNPTKQ